MSNFIFMGTLTGTTTLGTTTLSLLSLNSPDLGYIVILLMVIAGLLAIDLVRRLFTRR